MNFFGLPHYAYISLAKKLRVRFSGYFKKCGLYFLPALSRSYEKRQYPFYLDASFNPFLCPLR